MFMYINYLFRIIASVGPDPCHVKCPSCQQSITTRTENVSTRMTHIVALLLCIFG